MSDSRPASGVMSGPRPLAIDVEVIAAMIERGGSFVQALGRAAFRADAGNRERIKRAFPEIWSEYAQVANRLRLRPRPEGSMNTESVTSHARAAMTRGRQRTRTVLGVLLIHVPGGWKTSNGDFEIHRHEADYGGWVLYGGAPMGESCGSVRGAVAEILRLRALVALHETEAAR